MKAMRVRLQGVISVWVCWVLAAAAFLPAPLAAQAPRASAAPKDLVALFKAWDDAKNDGKGLSEKSDSATLGWGEADYLSDYAAMWESTGDPYWLAKIRDHFRRVMASASDPDGDGFLSWQTTLYSAAVAWAERLHNVSDVQITPPAQKELDGGAAARCSGHSYLIEFPRDGAVLRIIDAQTHGILAEQVPYESGMRLRQIEPFTFVLTGAPHQGDRFLVSTKRPEPIEFAVHQGMLAYPVAQFIVAVLADPALRVRFGQDAEAFLAFINKNLFEKNEQDWLDMGALGGAYRFRPQITDRYPNRIMPHNQFGALARVWLLLKDIPGANPLMAQRAEAMARYFRRHLELDAARDCWKWHYWDWREFGKADYSGYEDADHSTIDVSLAVEAARHGVVFTEADMVRMAHTWVRVMWNQSETEPRMASDVAGGAPFAHSALLPNWAELSQWDRKVYELARKAFQEKNPEEQARRAPLMLLCAHRAGIVWR